MPPKDVKKAKKLFEKMKKEKEEKLREEAASKEGTPDTPPASDVTTETTANEPELSATELAKDEEGSSIDKSEPDAPQDTEEEPAKGAEDPEQVEPTEPKSADANANSTETIEPEEPKVVEADLVPVVSEAQEVSHPVITETTDTSSNETTPAVEPIPVAVDQEEAPKITSESSESSVLPHLDPVIVVTKDSDTPSVSKPAAEPAKPDSSAEIIASLRDENETLRLQNENLQRKIAQLEGELEIARRPDVEVSLSPTYKPGPVGHFASTTNRDRRSSFVEANLFEHPDNLQQVATEMEKWKGFQLDMRNWQNCYGIGPIVSI